MAFQEDPHSALIIINELLHRDWRQHVSLCHSGPTGLPKGFIRQQQLCLGV